MQPVTLYSHQLGPNPWKEPFTALNPNGRLPALTDPNTNLTLWESGAIIQYLIDTYDAEKHRLSYDSFPERYLTQQWLHFQMSGQGPYYGQLGWFKRQTNPEEQTLAITRYGNEVRRITGVLDSVLAEREWLVGDKCTYADLSFVPWQDMLAFMMGEEEEKRIEDDFPNVTAWMERMKARPEVAKVLGEKRDALAAMMAQGK